MNSIKSGVNSNLTALSREFAESPSVLSPLIFFLIGAVALVSYYYDGGGWIHSHVFDFAAVFGEVVLILVSICLILPGLFALIYPQYFSEFYPAQIFGIFLMSLAVPAVCSTCRFSSNFGLMPGVSGMMVLQWTHDHLGSVSGEVLLWSVLFIGMNLYSRGGFLVVVRWFCALPFLVLRWVWVRKKRKMAPTIKSEADGKPVVEDDRGSRREGDGRHLMQNALVLPEHPLRVLEVEQAGVDLEQIFPGQGESYTVSQDEDQEQNELCNALVICLGVHGVRACVHQIFSGPSVVSIELIPEEGTKLKEFRNLESELQLHLKARGIRVTAPIPGTGFVGVEITREKVHPVDFAEVISKFTKAKDSRILPAILGVNPRGELIGSDVTALPHLLIAGSTGSGKSSFLHSLFCSLLLAGNPSNLKALIIDPKRVEFQVYDDLPQMLTPAIHDPMEAFEALGWAVDEMEDRYARLAKKGASSLEQYNGLSKGRNDQIPYLVILIDELSSLMEADKKRCEKLLHTLCAKGRAAGMHLLIATQRPSVDVISGVIKANIPARVALRVSSKTDSRVILDSTGAESLSGAGDMLVLGPDDRIPKRLQSPWINRDQIMQAVGVMG
jgi:hypothetical protein